MPEVLDRLNECAHISFPFVEDTILADGTGALQLEDSFLLDLQAMIYSQDAGRLGMTAVAVNPAADELLVTFTYTPLAGAVITASALVPASASAWASMDSYRAAVHIAGVVSLYPVFGPGVADAAAGRGGNTYVFASCYIEPQCICVRNRHIVTGMSSSTDVKLTGHVKVQGGYNSRISVIPSANALVIGAAIGEGLGMPCTQVLPVPRNCENLVYSINGMTPDWSGELTLQGGGGISIQGVPAHNKLVITTPYRACEPGCKE
jgi:hypothetical protein